MFPSPPAQTHGEESTLEAGANMMTEHVIPLGFPTLTQHNNPGNLRPVVS